jgi:hypothetical protein
MNIIIKFLLNPWVITLVGGLVVIFVSNHFFGTGRGGGNGGKATVNGSGTAIGGPGGGGGPSGIGGAGGDAIVNGDGFAAGGGGGEAGQVDRGGRGGISGYEAAGLPNFQLPDGRWIYDIGRGGDGGGPVSTSDNSNK